MLLNNEVIALSYPIKHLCAAGYRINSETYNLAKEQDFSLFSSWWQMLWHRSLHYFVGSHTVQCFEL